MVVPWVDQYLWSFQIYTCIKRNLMLLFQQSPFFINAMLLIHMYVESKTLKTYFLKILILIIKTLKVEVNPLKLLDTEHIWEKRSILTQVFNKLNKFPVHWSSKIPVGCKHNTIIGELRRAKRTASNFDKEIRRIR